MASSLNLNLPNPSALSISSPEAQNRSQQLTALIRQKISDSGGWIDFSTFMHMVLYAPGLGYYSGGGVKFADSIKGGGDFVTAPQISPLFARTLARQAAQVILQTQGNILELGAGTGKLAADLLLELQRLNQLPEQYYILEVSDYLRQIQLETMRKFLSADLIKRVVWLDTLPTDFVGLIFGNEILDAIPVHLIYQSQQGWFERGIVFEDTPEQQGFNWQDKPLADLNLIKDVSAHSLPGDYLTEVCPAANGLIASLAQSLKQGVILMLDYGFGAPEYYHPQRSAGTLMCHYQHQAHSNPLVNAGLQDVTAHVNFTAIAETGLANGLSLAGYCNQASFLMNCGILEILSETSPNDIAAYMPLAAAAQKLLSPAEMGELFKVIALSIGIPNDLIGFKSGDKAHML
ncbi:class I SAM-dependent methyltransferase [Methylotenera versatilis]|uniref:class I SAM-dependent methyltransferase n=1 Tax=Methylotenera versatilis TaxID=1055487 RepID=UPI0006470378|nr:SAM-dependent methyltransferase [Methylotenera versatilis]